MASGTRLLLSVLFKNCLHLGTDLSLIEQSLQRLQMRGRSPLSMTTSTIARHSLPRCCSGISNRGV